jgi:hypothetical protein
MYAKAVISPEDARKEAASEEAADWREGFLHSAI